MIWGNHCKSRDLLQCIIIVVSLLIFYLFTRHFFGFFFLFIQCFFSIILAFWVWLGCHNYVISKILSSGKNIEPTIVLGLAITPGSKCLEFNNYI